MYVTAQFILYKNLINEFLLYNLTTNIMVVATTTWRTNLYFIGFDGKILFCKKKSKIFWAWRPSTIDFSSNFNPVKVHSNQKEKVATSKRIYTYVPAYVTEAVFYFLHGRTFELLQLRLYFTFESISKSIACMLVDEKIMKIKKDVTPYFYD